jgi:hypothetical protein
LILTPSPSGYAIAVPIIRPPCGQAWAGKSLENMGKSLIFRCDLRKVYEE